MFLLVNPIFLFNPIKINIILIISVLNFKNKISDRGYLRAVAKYLRELKQVPNKKTRTLTPLQPGGSDYYLVGCLLVYRLQVVILGLQAIYKSNLWSGISACRNFISHLVSTYVIEFSADPEKKLSHKFNKKLTKQKCDKINIELTGI